ncbi:putative pentatricopeptide repeat-containing protein At5g40405 [Rutidosis leptorrhynchoides]|uniref:putative pentatricopeptide repeat-containing protein At5g40405 n=1 Tax=Rutidosis leptorrhynchoides TaxID=125765 RepID=UPI003A995CBD
MKLPEHKPNYFMLINTKPLFKHFSTANFRYSLNQIKQSHAHLIISGHSHDSHAVGQLLAALAQSPSSIPSHYSLSILRSIQNPSIFAINNLIRIFAKSESPHESLSFYKYTRKNTSFTPNKYTFTFLLQACSKFDTNTEGTIVQGYVIKLGFYDNVYIRNVLIHLYFVYGESECASNLFNESPLCRDLVTWNMMMSGYARAGRIDDVEKVFDEMPERDVISWSSLITGYIQNGYLEKGLDCFKRMKDVKLLPNEAILVMVLSACAQLGLIENGILIHSVIEKMGCLMTVRVMNGLVDMYAKCGHIDKARDLFNKMVEKDTSSWNVMICGLATHGLGTETVEIFKKFLIEGYTPENVTFIGVLSACSKSGLVDEGRRYFNLMTEKYHIDPEMEHYGCMVDLLSRAGFVLEAVELVEMMLIPPDPVLWVTILGACRTHGLVELGEKIGKKLIQIEPNCYGNYVQLSSIYAKSHQWEEVVRTRSLIGRNSEKSPGWSLIEAQGKIHQFVAGDKEHEMAYEIYVMLDKMTNLFLVG